MVRVNAAGPRSHQQSAVTSASPATRERQVNARRGATDSHTGHARPGRSLNDGARRRGQHTGHRIGPGHLVRTVVPARAVERPTVAAPGNRESNRAAGSAGVVMRCAVPSVAAPPRYGKSALLTNGPHRPSAAWRGSPSTATTMTPRSSWRTPPRWIGSNRSTPTSSAPGRLRARRWRRSALRAGPVGWGWCAHPLKRGRSSGDVEGESQHPRRVDREARAGPLDQPRGRCVGDIERAGEAGDAALWGGFDEHER